MNIQLDDLYECLRSLGRVELHIARERSISLATFLKGGLHLLKIRTLIFQP